MNKSILAISGGPKVRQSPPPPWPSYSSKEISAVVSVLESGRVNQWTGSLVREFEFRFAEYFGAPFAVAVANGSVALELALRALGVGAGDEVIVPCRSFVATASSVNQVGATPIFADVDYATQVITPDTILPLITPRTRAVIVVHLNGRPCDMKGIQLLADTHGLLVVEDCAQSHGAKIGDKLLGTFGDASAFSFCQDKIMSTGGEGGMVLLKEKKHWARAWSYKDHGKAFEKVFLTTGGVGFRWLHDSLGTNWRMMEVQAALGLDQLGELSRWVDLRNENAMHLRRHLENHACFRIADVQEGEVHAYYRFDLRVEPDQLKAGWTRDRIQAAFLAEGIHASVGSCPVIAYEGAYIEAYRTVRFPNAERLGLDSLAFLTHPTIDCQYLDDCALAIEKIGLVASV